MKKIFLFLSAAVLMAVACNKSESVNTLDVPQAGEISFKAITNAATKAGELDGTILNKDYGIYAAATQKNAVGLIENAPFFAGNEQLFATADNPATASSQWKASPAQFWPMGGAKLDFLAYAELQASHEANGAAGTWAATWDNAATDVASKVSFYGVDTYAHQEDILYAASNGMTREANAGTKTVGMTFNHAQALLLFNVKVNDAGDELMKINEISFVSDGRVAALRDDATARVIYQAAQAKHTIWGEKKVADGYDAMDAEGKAAWDAANPEPSVPAEPELAAMTDADAILKTVGSFAVDNSRNTLLAGWTFGNDATKAANYVMPAAAARSDANKVGTGFVAYDALIPAAAEYAQLGGTLLIPEQEKVNFTIKYTIGTGASAKVMYYTYNDLRGVWKMGHKYYYNLDISFDEIVITENVVDFEPEQASTDYEI